ncbi:MAG: helicase HerA-like domain-containing protein [Pseudomonadota bacterium]
MNSPETLFIGKSGKAETLALKRANRHGLIAGATGTGKTVTLQILAEGFSEAGVPVFCADVKGDLSGLSQAGEMKDFLEERAETVGLAPYEMDGFPVVFWDLFGKKGHPIRTTISEMGPLLIARLLGLNETQEGVLALAFRLADDEGLLLLDLKDLRAMLGHVAERASELRTLYGNVSKASIGAIQRRLLTLEDQGARNFFGEPALDLHDFLQTDASGRGVINILMAEQLMTAPKLYATFLLWLLSELFEQLPEVGDPDKPKLVFFFDEAHLLFDDAPEALVDKIEQVVRLIRSKGVGVYFVTQNPADVPDSVLSQLGNRVQHALRAFTPREQKAVRAAAQTFRQNPKFDVEEAITQLGVGEALVSTLLKKGEPSVVQRTLIRPPSSRMGPITTPERKEIVAGSVLAGAYDKRVDRKSAYEILQARGEEAAEAALAQSEAEATTKTARRTAKSSASKSKRTTRTRRSSRQSPTEAAFKSVARAFGTQIGRAIARGVLGSLRR